MKILVCGGRGYRDYNHVYSTLRRIDRDLKITEVIHGDASGADQWGRTWAVNNGKKHTAYPAQWDKHGVAAGPIRNQQMIDEGKPALIVAFPGGRGTADMIRRANAAGIAVMEFRAREGGQR